MGAVRLVYDFPGTNLHRLAAKERAIMKSQSCPT